METKASGRWSRLGRRNENISGDHLLPRCVSGFLSALVCFTRTERERAGLYPEFFKKSSNPSSPKLTHTYTSPLHPWHVGPAVEHVIATPCPMLGRTQRPNGPCQRPDPGCEILDLTSSPFMKEHGGTE